MKAKKAASLFLAFVLISTAATLVDRVESQYPDFTLYVDPPSIKEPPYKAIGSNITINIRISYIERLHGWDLKLRYNPLLLYTNSSLVKEGDFLKSVGPTLMSGPFFEEDFLYVGCRINAQDWADGSGVLISIAFILMRYGETKLEIITDPNDPFRTELFRLDGSLIEIASQDGYFRNVDSNKIPVGDFSYQPAFPLWYENVTFSASTSYDPDGTISRYVWYFGGQSGDINTANETSPIVYHQYKKFQTAYDEWNATVRLLIIDNAGTTGNLSVRRLTVISFRPVHDLTVDTVGLNQTIVYPGNSVKIAVGIGNQGNTQETLNVTVFYDSHLIGTQTNITLNASSRIDVYFTWSTAGVTLGVYIIRANVTEVVGETDLLDNSRTSLPSKLAITFPPAASFVYTPSEPYVDMDVTFNASTSLGSIMNYSWNFGDGNITTVNYPIIEHTYAAGGTFTVYLTVRDVLKVTDIFAQTINVLKLPSTISLSLPTKAKVGSSLQINGSINPIPSKANVTILYRLLGEDIWNSLANITTDALGRYAFDWTPVLNGTFQMKAMWAGDKKYEGDESDVLLVDVTKLSSVVSLTLSPSFVVVGEIVSINGSLSPNLSLVKIAILYSRNNGVWRSLRNVTTDENGEYAVKWQPSMAGTYQVKAVWEGDNLYAGDESDVVTIEVRERPYSPFEYQPYILGAVLIVTLAAGLLYWKRLKGKRRGENRVFLVSWLISGFSAFVLWFAKVAADVMGLFGSLGSSEVVVSYIRNYQKVQIQWSLIGLYKLKGEKVVKHLRKTSLLLVIPLIVILGLALNLARAETATIFVYPQRTIGDLTPAPGSTLNLDVNVSDVTEPMWGYQFFLRFDPAVFPPIIPLTNMNFTDTGSTAWTTTTVGTVVGTAASGYDGADGNPSPGSGAPSYYLKATASITEAASITFSTEQTFTYNGKTPIKAAVSFAYRITGTSLGAGSTIGLRVVKPDATFKTLITTHTITSADLTKPWQFNITDTSLSAFDQVGTYRFQLRTMLKTANAGTFNYLQVNWDDVGLWISSAGGASEGPFLKAGGTTDFIVKYINESAIYIADSLTIPPPGGVTGSGKLASVSLVVRYGRSWLDLAGVKLIKLGNPPNYPPVEMAYIATDGFFDNRIPGDITGPGGAGVYDGKVDIYDLGYIGKAFGSADPIADFTGPAGAPDGKVDIYDLGGCGKNFGRHYP